MRPANRRVAECYLQVDEFCRKPRARKLWKRQASKAARRDTGLPLQAHIRTGWWELFEPVRYSRFDLFDVWEE